jgi:cellulose synthase/poly-beta-1,6-N-acetylglucosamine synthase-like glycosyltransferase
MTDTSPASPGSGDITVIVTVLDDPRLERTLESLLVQTRPPQEILIADGDHSPTIAGICTRFAARDSRFRRVDAPGTIAESRNRALGEVHSEFLAFLDTDEVAPPDWLERLMAPFADGQVGFVGGPTPGMPGSEHNMAARYYDAYLRRFYDRVASQRPHALPMGNSAWRTRLFRELGPLDLSVSGFGSEDQEMALRALRAGWRGVYVPTAPVQHDFSDLGWWSLFRKQRRYGRGGYAIWRRTGSTYEASVDRVLPYVALPFVGVIGLVFLPFSELRLVGAALCLLGFGGLALLAVVLTFEGRREDARYPGYRYRVVEIWRRWATLLGALEGAATPARRPTPPRGESVSQTGKL